MFQHLYLYQERVFFVLCPSEVPLKKKNDAVSLVKNVVSNIFT